MMSNIQAVKLIIENIKYLEQAKILLEGEVTEKTLMAVDTVVQEHINGLGQWSGIFEFNENTNLQFAPKNWQAKQGADFKYQNFYARYYLECESGETGGNSHGWWLSTFLKNDLDHMILGIYPYFENFKEKVNKTKWSKFANEQNQLIPQIEQEGFKFNASNGSWYLIIDGIEPQDLIENYENDISAALIPITDALNMLEKVHPYFDQIVQAAIEKFGRVDSEDAA